MKAITLYQPWASLVAMGEKMIETRSWSTKYRGPLAIHAGMNHKFMKLIAEHPFSDVFSNINLFPFHFPFGQVIAVCELVDCLQVLDVNRAALYKKGRKAIRVFVPPNSPELEFGDYTPGRFAWILGEVKMLAEPIPASGMLGLWNWEIPGELRSTLDGQKETTQGTRKGDRYGR